MYRKHLIFTLFIAIQGCLDSTKELIPVNGTFDIVPSTVSNLHFSNDLPENEQMNNLVYDYYYNGGGVAIGDINNDNLPDIYLTANFLQDRIYINKGNMEFDDITEQSGIVDTNVSWSTGVTMVDINNDNLLDIYVCKSGRFGEEKRENRLFINNGDLTFTERGKEYGLNSSDYSTQSAFFDFDQGW